jgi:hypothetical protein
LTETSTKCTGAGQHCGLGKHFFFFCKVFIDVLMVCRNNKSSPPLHNHSIQQASFFQGGILVRQIFGGKSGLQNKATVGLSWSRTILK